MSEKRQLIRYAEIFVLFMGFFVIADGFREILPVWTPIRILYLGMLAAVSLLHIKNILIVVLRSPHILILVIFAALSALWSENRGATLSRTVALGMTTLFAAYFASKYTLREQVHMLAIAIGLYVVTSVLVVFGIPGHGTEGLAWEGVFTQKNVFGRVMAVGVMVSLVYPATNERVKRYKQIGFLVCLALVGLSISMTSLIATLGAIALFYAYRVLRLGALPFAAMVLALAVPVGVTAYAAVNIDPAVILEGLGRDATLTGRTELWDKVSYAIEQRPWFGYGYGGFWNMWGGTYGTLWTPRDNWQPGSAHNSYLDITVNLGVVGLTLFLVGFIITIVQALRKVRSTDTSYEIWPALYIGFLTAISFSEDFVLINHIFWTLYVTLAFTLNKPVWLESPEKYQPRRYITAFSVPTPTPTGG